METKNTTEIDFSEMQPVAIVRLLRGMVAMCKDKKFMSCERVDVAAMTEQADTMYATLLLKGFSVSQIAQLVPGVEVFA